ncbi:hypothetical protein KEM56_006834 [Ascosphaera pollenicola]|nr:hypothetical protein KEM56_006834 [Ascosphaera pollenicola]
MFFIPKFLALGALVTSVLGAPAGTPTYRGSFIIQNNCKDNIIVHDSTIKGDKLLCSSTAMSIHYTTEDRYTFIALGDVRGNLTDNKVPRLIFAYQLQQGSNEHVIYQVSYAYGESFKGKQVTVDTPDNECPRIDWPEGVTTGRSLIVENSCRFPIFAWHAPPGKNISIASAIDPFTHVNFQYQAIHNQAFDVLVSPDPLAVAKDIHNRIPGSDTDNAGINNGDNEPGLAGSFTVFTYEWVPAVGKTMMTYTLDNCNGDPFVGHEIMLASSTEACQRIDWPAGVPTAAGRGQMWFDCPMTTWMTLTLCAETA